VRHDLEDAVIGIEKHDVDRKAHEEGVDGLARRDDERAALRQEIAFQQTPATALRVERALQRVRDDPIVARVRQDE